MPFTNPAFEHPSLPDPLPVVNIFQWSWRIMAVLRMFNGLFPLSFTNGPTWLAFKIFLLVVRITRAVSFRFPTVVPQAFLAPVGLPTAVAILLTGRRDTVEEYIGITLFLGRRSPLFHVLFWFHYFVNASNSSDFIQNYIEAWGRRPSKSIWIFVKDSSLKVPIPLNGDDRHLFERIQMFYRMIQWSRNLSELFLPRQVDTIYRVKLRGATTVAIIGQRLEVLDFGRIGGRWTRFLDDPNAAGEGTDLAKKLLKLPDDEGLEFVRSWDRASTSFVVLAPFIASIIVAAVWTGVLLHKGDDLQTTVQTAFTIASYIVTAGALIIALVAFLDQQERSENESANAQLLLREDSGVGGGGGLQSPTFPVPVPFTPTPPPPPLSWIGGSPRSTASPTV